MLVLRALKRGRESCLPHNIKMRLPKNDWERACHFSTFRSFDLRQSIQSLPPSSLHPRALLTTRHCARSILHLHPPQTQQSHQQTSRHALSRLGHPSVPEELRSALQGVQDHLLRRARGRFCQRQWYVYLIQGLEQLSELTCTRSTDCEALAHLFRAWSSRWGQVQHFSPLMDPPGSRWLTGNVGPG
jgi:hypothetical protein